MDTTLLETIAKLRLYIGYLGEKNQFNWWASAFFSPSSSAFLEPLFGRTQLLAQCNGVTRAAALVHDERIGVGHVYHLFRLPEDLEQGLHQVLHNSEFGQTLSSDATRTLVLEKLGSLAIEGETLNAGPIRAGNVSDLYLVDNWKKVAGLYVDAFQAEKKAYPYFANIS